MGQIVIHYPDDQRDFIFDAFCAAHRYPSEVPDAENVRVMVPNPESKAEFVKRTLCEFVCQSVLAHEVRTAKAAATTSAKTNVDAKLLLS